MVGCKTTLIPIYVLEEVILEVSKTSLETAAVPGCTRTVERPKLKTRTELWKVLPP